MKELKDMPRKEAHRIFDAWLDGAQLEITSSIDIGRYNPDALVKGFCYSIQVTYPEVPWDLIDEKWNWYAVGKDGISRFYESEPIAHILEHWDSDGYAMPSPLKINNGTCHWTETKTRRPE